MTTRAQISPKGSERRRHMRKGLDDQALIMILTGEDDIFERAQVQDISHGGICFAGIGAAGCIENENFRITPDQQVVAYFKNASLTVFGRVKRIDDESGTLALVVSNSTNRDLWYTLCA